MVGRAEKGIFLTTGTFTKPAVDEASREGAGTIDLIDGAELSRILKDLELGVKTQQLIIIDDDWFKEFDQK